MLTFLERLFPADCQKKLQNILTLVMNAQPSVRKNEKFVKYDFYELNLTWCGFPTNVVVITLPEV